MVSEGIVGILVKRVIDEFQLTLPEGTEIYLGTSNILHMKSAHPRDFAKYGDKITDIILNPTYICQHPKNGSIEFIKAFANENNEHVLVAIRASVMGRLYARTIFVMSQDKIEKYKQKNIFIKF